MKYLYIVYLMFDSNIADYIVKTLMILLNLYFYF